MLLGLSYARPSHSMLSSSTSNVALILGFNYLAGFELPRGKSKSSSGLYTPSEFVSYLPFGLGARLFSLAFRPTTLTFAVLCLL